MPKPGIAAIRRFCVLALIGGSTLPLLADEGGLMDRSHLFGDPAGFRATLLQSGWEPQLEYADTWMGDLSGGMGRGSAYKGNLIAGITGDLGQSIGWIGASVFVSGVNTHGESLSGRFVGDSLGTRKDDENPRTHLFEAGLEQSLSSNTVALKIGLLAVTSDFFQSASGFFTHNSFNWGPNGQSNAPSGPDSALGARLRFQLAASVYAEAAIYDNVTGGEIGPGQGGEEVSRGAWPSGDRAVYFAETGYTPAHALFGLPGALKAGAWFDQANHLDNLGGPAHGDNWGAYLVAEQVVFTEKTGAKQGLKIFSRLAYAPSDRNQFDWQINAGAIYTGLVPGRDADVTGIAFTDAVTSASWRAATGAGAHEEATEIKYQFAVSPWWHLDLFGQYIIHPGAPNARQLNNALVLGLGNHFVF
jgi:porin